MLSNDCTNTQQTFILYVYDFERWKSKIKIYYRELGKYDMFACEATQTDWTISPVINYLCIWVLWR